MGLMYSLCKASLWLMQDVTDHALRVTEAKARLTVFDNLLYYVSFWLGLRGATTGVMQTAFPPEYSYNNSAVGAMTNAAVKLLVQYLTFLMRMLG